MTNTEVIYDENRLNESQILIEEIKNDLYDADRLLYDAVMKISYATGMKYIEEENTSIDMRVPEQLMIQCRETTTDISERINKNINTIDQFNQQILTDVITKPNTDPTSQETKVQNRTNTEISSIEEMGEGLTSHVPPSIINNNESQVKTGIENASKDSLAQTSIIPETGINKKESLKDYTAPIAAGLAIGIGGIVAEKKEKKEKEKTEE